MTAADASFREVWDRATLGQTAPVASKAQERQHTAGLGPSSHGIRGPPYVTLPPRPSSERADSGEADQAGILPSSSSCQRAPSCHPARSYVNLWSSLPDAKNRFATGIQSVERASLAEVGIGLMGLEDSKGRKPARNRRGCELTGRMWSPRLSRWLRRRRTRGSGAADGLKRVLLLPMLCLTGCRTRGSSWRARCCLRASAPPSGGSQQGPLSASCFFRNHESRS